MPSPDAGATAMTMIDVTVVHLGLAAFVWQGLFTAFGSRLYLCYFPILAIAASRYRIMPALKAAAYAGAGYAVISLLGGSSPWFPLTIMFTASSSSMPRCRQ